MVKKLTQLQESRSIYQGTNVSDVHWNVFPRGSRLFLDTLILPCYFLTQNFRLGSVFTSTSMGCLLGIYMDAFQFAKLNRPCTENRDAINSELGSGAKGSDSMFQITLL